MHACFPCVQAQERQTGDNNHLHPDRERHPSTSHQRTEKSKSASSKERPEGSGTKRVDNNAGSRRPSPRVDTKQAEKSDDEQVFETYTAPNGEQYTTYVREDGKRFYLDLDKSGAGVSV